MMNFHTFTLRKQPISDKSVTRRSKDPACTGNRVAGQRFL
jgi:hypothetical protein